MLPGNANDGLTSPYTDNPSPGITIPPLGGTIGHTRQKPSRVGLADRQYSYDVTSAPSVRVGPLSNPSPPPIHHRQYSEGAGGDRLQSTLLNGGRNASVSSLDTSQATFTSNGMEPPTQALGGGRRRHGHSHSHAHSHHHHPSHAGPVPPKPASMMSTLPTCSRADDKVRLNTHCIFFSPTLSVLSKICSRKSWLFPSMWYQTFQHILDRALTLRSIRSSTPWDISAPINRPRSSTLLCTGERIK